MTWKLIDIVKETNHKFLNFYTLIYEVNDGHNIKTYSYYLASRNDANHLLAIYQHQKPDGVVIPCYYIDEHGDIYFLLTSQFRPALNQTVTSVPAGLLDENDDVFSCAKREALEEGGVVIDELELLCPSSPTSSGLSDEINAVVLGKIIEKKENSLEEFEDLTTKLIKIDEVEKMLNDDNYFFALNVRLLLKYLILRFKKS